MSRRALIAAALIVVAWLGVAGFLGSRGVHLSEVSQSGSLSYLPPESESVAVLNLSKSFGPEQDTLPAVVVFERTTGLTDGDKAAVADAATSIDTSLGSAMTGKTIGPIFSEDGQAAQLIVLFTGTNTSTVVPHVEELRALLKPPAGLSAHVTGPAGTAADLHDATGAIDILLIVVTSVVILLILVVVYRSVLLPLLVLTVAGIGLLAAMGLLYLLADQGVITIGSEVQGIFSVLILGAGTDYALLMIGRYREQLKEGADRKVALRTAWRYSLAPIISSGGTVILALLCLLFSDLGLNRALGPAGAIGVACAVIVMITLLPAVLLLCGRAVFWPRREAIAAPTEPVRSVGGRGLWVRISSLVERRSHLVWIGSVLVLGLMALGVTQLNAKGLSDADYILDDDIGSKIGTQIVDRHFPGGGSNPAVLIAKAPQAQQVAAAAAAVPGVAQVVPYTGAEDGVGDGRPKVVNGLVQYNVILDANPQSQEAQAAVERLRDAVHAVPGANAMIGGATAIALDFNTTAAEDRGLLPLLLLVVLVVVAVLLRALIAPILLVATVVLSYLAAIGVSALVFEHIFGFPGVDSTFPLHTFVFLVALGVDYNIFLITRVHEESLRHGTKQGVLIGLRTTGGVISSAGIVLAATFAALAVVPLVLLIELAFTVAFGVLLDTLLVRTLLVPSLIYDVGRFVWWPGQLWIGARRARPADRPEPRRVLKPVY